MTTSMILTLIIFVIPVIAGPTPTPPSFLGTWEGSWNFESNSNGNQCTWGCGDHCQGDNTTIIFVRQGKSILFSWFLQTWPFGPPGCRNAGIVNSWNDHTINVSMNCNGKGDCFECPAEVCLRYQIINSTMSMAFGVTFTRSTTTSSAENSAIGSSSAAGSHGASGGSSGGSSYGSSGGSSGGSSTLTGISGPMLPPSLPINSLLGSYCPANFAYQCQSNNVNWQTNFITDNLKKSDN